MKRYILIKIVFLVVIVINSLCAKDIITIHGKKKDYKFYKKDGIYFPKNPEKAQYLLFGEYSKFMKYNNGKAILVFYDSTSETIKKDVDGVEGNIRLELNLVKEVQKAFIKKKGIKFPIYAFEVKDWDKENKLKLTNIIKVYPTGNIDWPGFMIIYNKIPFYGARSPAYDQNEAKERIAEIIKTYEKKFYTP